MVDLTLPNVAQSVDDDTFCVVDTNDLGCTVWRAAVIDEASNATHLGRVDDSILVNAEKVTRSHTLLVISNFSQIGYTLSNLLTDILNNHVVGYNILLCVQTPVVDGGAIELDQLLSLLQLIKAQRITLGASHVLGDVNVVHHAAIVGTIGTRIGSRSLLRTGREFETFHGDNSVLCLLGLALTLLALPLHTNTMGQVLGLL